MAMSLNKFQAPCLIDGMILVILGLGVLARQKIFAHLLVRHSASLQLLSFNFVKVFQMLD